MIRLSGELVDELFTYCILGSMSWINLRAETNDCVRATDASDWGMAGVASVQPVNCCRELCRHSIQKSVWSQLLPPGKAWLRSKQMLDESEELPEEQFDCHPLFEVAARALEYKECWRLQHQKPVHINIAELRAHLKEESHLAISKPRSKQIYGLDSQVALGCLVKGRSSSRVLNKELLRSLPMMIGSDLYGFYMYFPSKLNRADGPTRGAMPPAADVDPPSWWAEVAVGSYESFDKWMFDADASLHGPGYGSLASQCLMQQDALKEQKLAKRHRRKQEDLKTAGGGNGQSDPTPSDELRRRSSLDDEAVSILLSFTEEQVVWSDGVTSFLEAGALDLFSGRAGVARALAKMGCPWIVCFEWCRSSEEDLLDEALRAKILRFVELKAVRLVGSAIICCSFSIAVTPPCRNHRYLRGRPGLSENMRLKVSEGNSHSDFNKTLLKRCEDYQCHWWFENPDSSWLWRQRGYQRYRAADSKWVMRVDYCRFKAPWRKRTRVGTSIPMLQGLRMLCKGGHTHIALRGRSAAHGKAWTMVAQPYPKGFCHLIARAGCKAVGWGRNIPSSSSCARCSCSRIGEAKNPGPRMNRRDRTGTLSSAPLQTQASLLLGEKAWNKFYSWCCRFLGSNQEPLDVFLQVPLFLVHALRTYGDVEYQRGGAQSNFRHLILEAFRRVPHARQYGSIAWDYASRWQALEPTKHRVPLPHPLLKAMVVLAYSLGWWRWAGCCLLAFFGVGRIGEVLRCRRCDLLLPADLLDMDSSHTFLVLNTSKTMRRGGGRIQHMKIEEKYVTSLLAGIFSRFDPDCFLYPGSPSTFRRRWDFLLNRLLVPHELSITPGSLRGGGAVFYYRLGYQVPQLLWKMRIHHASTLESYLQEVAALSALTEMPKPSLKLIRSACELFPFLGSSFAVTGS